MKKHPKAVSEAADKILQMIEKFKAVLQKADKEMVEEWVKELIVVKTFAGLKFQEAVLKAVSLSLGKEYRLAVPVEESQGIDGFIGQSPVSIKPASYELKKSLGEIIEVPVLFYEKTKKGIQISFDPSDFI